MIGTYYRLSLADEDVGLIRPKATAFRASADW